MTSSGSSRSPPRRAASMPPTSPRAWRSRRRSLAGRGGSSGEALAAPRRAQLSAPIATGDRVAPVAAESATTDPYSGRRLAALVFVALHQVQHPRDGGTLEAARLDLVHRQVLLDEGVQNRVQHLVGRQRV